MFEWNKNIQQMVDWIENNITESLTLTKMAKQLNYSPFYCTKQFHSLTGMKLRDYIRLRRISHAALELRDTNVRILDIAVKYGFSSQEAFTRAFVKAYDITPSVYRKSPKPLPLLLKREVFNPYILGIEVPLDYSGNIPEGMECIEIPESKYAVFYHPPYIYNDISDSVMEKVDEMAWNWNPQESGYQWNELKNPIYQRSNPEKFGYEIWRPIQ